MAAHGTFKVFKASLSDTKEEFVKGEDVERMMKVEELLKHKKKFERKATENDEENEDDLLFEEESGVIKKKSIFKLGKILVSFDCAIGYLMLPDDVFSGVGNGT